MISQTNPQAAWSNLFNASRSFSTVGTGSDGASYKFNINIDPSGKSKFNSADIYDTATLSSSLYKNNLLTTSERNVVYFLPDKGVAATKSADGSCIISSAYSLLPTTANLNAFGPLYSGKYLIACAAQFGQDIATWSFESDQGVALFCQNIAFRRTEYGKDVYSSQSTCMEVNAAGDIGSRARVTISLSGGFSVVTRNY